MRRAKRDIAQEGRGKHAYRRSMTKWKNAEKNYTKNDKRRERREKRGEEEKRRLGNKYYVSKVRKCKI
jgi:hypothetical protein